MTRILVLAILILIGIDSRAQEIEYAKSIVSRLASPEFKGRGYTGNGNQLAAEYITSEFKRIGLKPISKSYDQKFNISVNTFPGEISLKLNNEILSPGIDYLVEASSPGIKGKFAITKVNRKDIDTQEKQVNLINNSGESFILIDNTVKFTDDKDLNKKIDEFITFLKLSPQITYKGIIIYTKEKLTWDSSTSQSVRPVIIINKEMDLNLVSEIDLIIECKFIKNYTTQNITGIIKGSSVPDSFIVVIAHYDHLGQMGAATYFPGANDNASGVAMILNLASYYAKNPPKYSMVFIALSGEELGILGAKEFTENPLIRLDRIKFLINFDLAGTGEEGIRVVNGSIYKDKFDLLVKLNNEYQLLPKVDIRGAACNSDHCYFYQKGVLCFYIYTQGGIKAYHDIYDKPETLPLTEFVDYCKLMVKFFDEISL
ncbi:MAG: M28 family peptidase [Mariniphaga sp.]